MKIHRSVKVEKDFYDEAREVFKQFGLSFGDAINLFLAKVSLEKGIPFDLKLPQNIEYIDKKEEKEIKEILKDKECFDIDYSSKRSYEI